MLILTPCMRMHSHATCMHAGHQVKPHLICRRTMARPQRCFKEKEKKNSISAIVFLNLTGKVFVKLLTGSKGVKSSKKLAKLMPKKVYLNRDGKPAARMTSEEYIDCVKEAIAFFDDSPRTLRGLASWTAGLRLVHDRSTCHQRTDITVVDSDKAACVLPVIVAPPRSPDLMPLDYGVFGTAKNKLLNQVSQKDAWVHRAETFVQLLRDTDVSRIIASYPRRLEKCAANNGGRVESMNRQ